MSKWKWGRKLQEAYAQWGLQWEIVTMLNEDELGTSPGDTTYRNRRVYIEEDAPLEWVAHELAHFIEAKIDRPGMELVDNYGFEEIAGRLPLPLKERVAHHKISRVLEERAADLTVALLVRLNRPWRVCAEEPQHHSVSELRQGPGVRNRKSQSPEGSRAIFFSMACLNFWPWSV